MVKMDLVLVDINSGFLADGSSRKMNVSNGISLFSSSIASIRRGKNSSPFSNSEIEFPVICSGVIAKPSVAIEYGLNLPNNSRNHYYCMTPPLSSGMR